MDELPEVPAVTINQTLRIGVTLRRALEEAARVEGCDATYLGRRLLREQLEVQDRSLWPGGGHER